MIHRIIMSIIQQQTLLKKTLRFIRCYFQCWKMIPYKNILNNVPFSPLILLRMKLNNNFLWLISFWGNIMSSFIIKIYYISSFPFENNSHCYYYYWFLYILIPFFQPILMTNFNNNGKMKFLLFKSFMDNNKKASINFYTN